MKAKKITKILRGAQKVVNVADKILDIKEDPAGFLSDTIGKAVDKLEDRAATKVVVEEVVEEDDDVEYTTKSYFTDDELRCKGSGQINMDKDFMLMLNTAREIAGSPWIVTSGYRSVEHNKAVGGVADSAHTKGMAADISAATSAKKFEVVVAALAAGFTRIGIGSTFIHLDNDNTKTQNLIFPY